MYSTNFFILMIFSNLQSIDKAVNVIFNRKFLTFYDMLTDKLIFIYYLTVSSSQLITHTALVEIIVKVR